MAGTYLNNRFLDRKSCRKVFSLWNDIPDNLDLRSWGDSLRDGVEDVSGYEDRNASCEFEQEHGHEEKHARGEDYLRISI